MTFFYDLNKKLANIGKTGEQLNERDEGKPGKNFEKIAKDAGERYGSKAAGERVAGAVRNKLRAQGKLEESDMDESAFQAAIGKKKYGEEGMKALQKAGRDGASAKTMSNIRNKYDKYDESMEEGLGDAAKKIGGMVKKVGGKVLDTLGHGSDEDLIRDLQRKAGVPQTGKKPQTIAFHKSNAVDDNAVVGKVKEEGGNPMSAKQRSFAALAEPKDKITFADKIAGAKKEVDEMLGDVAAEAIKGALSPKQKKLDKNNNGKLDANDFAMLRKGAKGRQETDEGWDDMMKDVERRRSQTKKGEITHGHKHDIEDTGTGRRVTRRVDPNTGYSVGADDDKAADGEKRGRGRPKGTGKSMGAKGPSGKSKLMTKEGGAESSELKAAMSLLKKAGYKVTKANEAEELDEKAVSKKQQRFMGMVHAAQKGEKPASKEVAKVAKTMKKSDAEDFAATKHKGLPEKKKPEDKKDSKSEAPKKKKEKTEEQGGTGTPTASSGFGFGKGIYDSLNRELETMISESMSVNMSDSTEGGKSLTITATDEDALKLAGILQMAGLGGQDGHEQGYEETCPSCGNAPCGCAEVVDENSPDWPTDEETSDDAMQYSGGLNGPKSTGQTVGAPFNRQAQRQGPGATDVLEDAELARIKEMAGIKEGKKPDFLDVDKDGNKKESFKKAVTDKEDKKVEESILSLTNLWKTYKG